MPMRKNGRLAIRTLRMGNQRAAGAGAIHECEEHGWAKGSDRPRCRERALELAWYGHPDGVSALDAVAESAPSWIHR